ncbi:MAG: hypothetical protein IJD13_07410, partial [Oscillospiraceae bacterium]|nr:hypothetical protein [Oscillospiraceae bacterium]
MGRIGPLTKKIYQRIIICFCIFCAGFSALYLRIGLLGRSEELTETAIKQSRYTLTAVNDRGIIYDRELVPLTGEETEAISVILPSAENAAEVIKSVPEPRRETASDLLARGAPFLLPGVKLPTVDGVFVFEQQIRHSGLAPHILGYLNSEGQGVTGIEKSYDAFLSENGRQVELVCTLDGLQRPIAGIKPDIRESGSDRTGIVLTLDKEIQTIIEQLGAKMLDKGAIVVMEPHSGEILASASFPDYDTADLSAAVNDTQNTPMINRAFLPYSVGSTFKIVTAAAVLEEGIAMTQVTECT